jgi:hypothetical protein
MKKVFFFTSFCVAFVKRETFAAETFFCEADGVFFPAAKL